MATQDHSGTNRSNDAASPEQAPVENGPQSDAVERVPTTQDATWLASEDAPTTQPIPNVTRPVPKRLRWVTVTQSRLAASLHKIRLTGATGGEGVPLAASASSAADTTEPVVSTSERKSGKRRKASKDRLQDWDTWSKYRLWRRTRPLWGSILMALSALILLIPILPLLQFAFLVNSFWASILIGALLLVMALIQLFVPSYSIMTGSIGIVLSLVSFITNNFGGLCVGMVLGLIGSSLSLAWRPVKRSKLVAARSTATP